MPAKCNVVYCPLLYQNDDAGPNQVPPVGPTYIYGEKEKKTKRGELLRSAGKYTN